MNQRFWRTWARWFRSGWIVLCVPGLLGCANLAEPQRISNPVSTREDLAPCADHGGGAVSKCSLVQILVYGLGVLDWRDQEEPSSLLLHVRRVDNHDAFLWTRDPTDCWTHRCGAEGEVCDLEGVDYARIGLEAQDVVLRRTVESIPRRPQDSYQAQDHRWLLRSPEFERVHFLQSARARPHITFPAGTLETCGLVHDSGWNPCVVVTGGKGLQPKVERSLAEYMVIRHAVQVDDIATVLNVDLDGKPIDVRSTELSSCSSDTLESCLYWQGNHYRRVFDLALINAPEGGAILADCVDIDPPVDAAPRQLTTSHASWYLRELFPGAENSWEIEASECSNFDLQPTCVDYFFETSRDRPWDVPPLRRNGANQPVCPMVGYP